MDNPINQELNKIFTSSIVKMDKEAIISKKQIKEAKAGKRKLFIIKGAYGGFSVYPEDYHTLLYIMRGKKKEELIKMNMFKELPQDKLKQYWKLTNKIDTTRKQLNKLLNEIMDNK